MISVEEAIAAILEGANTLGPESVPLGACAGRVAAVDVTARMTQPPFAASAMDGYAVRFGDADEGETLKVIGEAPAGAPFAGAVASGECVRIFTGGVVPQGADHVVIQEDVTRDGDQITINEPQDNPRNIRAAGIDFEKGDILARAGDALHEMHGSIFAAANIDAVLVTRRPKVVIFSNGDELVEPGGELKPGQIVNSNHYALAAMIRRWGGEVDYLGCAEDQEAAIRTFFARGRDADIIVPVGGASVGDYDYVKSAFSAEGGVATFEKVAVRPGKPTWFGKLDKARVIGLPGNPASALVTAALFVQPLVRRLAGMRFDPAALFQCAPLRAPLGANGRRESYLRGVANASPDGFVITPTDNQDSSLLAPFAKANVLIRRAVDAPAAAAGDEVEFVWLR
ncbi:MAG: gephyrin-like molybdotransferase Glp [Pseudomonadota bacterium]